MTRLQSQGEPRNWALSSSTIGPGHVVNRNPPRANVPQTDVGGNRPTARLWRGPSLRGELATHVGGSAEPRDDCSDFGGGHSRTARQTRAHVADRRYGGRAFHYRGLRSLRPSVSRRRARRLRRGSPYHSNRTLARSDDRRSRAWRADYARPDLATGGPG